MKRWGSFVGYFIILLSAMIACAQLADVPTGTIGVEVQTIATGLSSPVDLIPVNDGSGRLFIRTRRPDQDSAERRGERDAVSRSERTDRRRRREGIARARFSSWFCQFREPGRDYSLGEEKTEFPVAAQKSASC